MRRRCSRFLLDWAPFAAVLAGLCMVGGPIGSALAQQDPGEDVCNRGQGLYRAGDFDAAKRALIDCLSEGKESLDILLPLTVMAVRGDRPGEGVAYAERAVALAPDDAEAKYWFGRALLGDGRVEEARRQWQDGLEIDMGHQGILEGLARLALNENQPAKAYQLLTQMQRQGADDAWLHRLLADIAASKGMWGQSLAHMESALEREPGTAADFLSASELSILADRADRAVAFCRRAVNVEPGAASYGGLGEAFFAHEQLDSALVYLRKAVHLGGASSRFRFNLANALEVAGMWEEADDHFRAFLREEPDDPVGRFNYGIHLQKRGRSEEALLSVEQAIDLDPDMLTARVVQSQILESLGRWDEALAAVRELRKRDTANAQDLEAWIQRLQREGEQAQGARAAGKYRLRHMVIADAEVLAKVTAELADGGDFATLAVRYSTGPAAVKGGDIGWIDPGEMVEPLRGAILKLDLNEISPPIESKGLYHLFMRVP